MIDAAVYKQVMGSFPSGVTVITTLDDDGQVVGINVAFIPKNEIDVRARPDLADKERVSVFMSYSEIDKEWRRYQHLLAKKGRPQLPVTPVRGMVVAATAR